MKVYPTCSLCQHFDANAGHCDILEVSTVALDSNRAETCQKEGHFIRNMNVLLDSYHLFAENEAVPMEWKMDFSKVPKDERGVPLFVQTKRGIERVIAANTTVLLKGDMLLGVNKVFTFQGQRELIYDLGVELAQQIAAYHGVKLTVLPGEENFQGIEAEKKKHYLYQSQKRKQIAVNSWEWDHQENEERW
jgi:hypothetical protein